MQSQQGRVVLITGANSGIGRATAQALAAAGATTIVAGRDAAKVAETVARLRERLPQGDVEPLLLDLASLASIREAAESVLSRWPRLDVLVNNAGLYLSQRRTTVDGFEMTFGVNHLGHFYLTSLLLDRLRSSTPSRVVTVSSVGHRFARGLDFDDLQNERHYTVNEAYCRSKLANVLFTKELARREAASGVSAYAVHPGSVRSGFGQDGDTRGVMGAGLALTRWFMIGPARAAAASLHAATTPGIEPLTGAYFQRSLFGSFGPVRAVEPSAAARDPAMAGRLWETSEALVAAAAR